MPVKTDRVLLIDDDPIVLSALSRYLHSRYDVVTAMSGALAVQAARQALQESAPFSVAVCDMRMPGMDGIQTLKEIQAVDPTVVGIIMTGDSDPSIAINALNSGKIFRFYAKPFVRETFLSGIADGIHQNRLQQAERNLAENEERWRLALEAVGDGVWDWDNRTNDTFFSRGWWRMLNVYDRVGMAPVIEWWTRVHPDDAKTLKAKIDLILDGRDSTLNCEHRMRCHDGTYRWFLVRGVVLFHDENGQALRTIGTHTDITMHRQMEDLLRSQAQELTILATTDALTGLMNRRCFLEKAEEELQRSVRYKRHMALIMVDIDFFKKVNDTYGHAMGDVVLRRVTETLSLNMRSTDALGRLGGEEFALLLPESTDASARVVAEGLRKKVEDSEIILDNGVRINITASFGIASANPESPGETVTSILSRADAALYSAKQSGRNRVVSDLGD